VAYHKKVSSRFRLSRKFDLIIVTLFIIIICTFRRVSLHLRLQTSKLLNIATTTAVSSLHSTATVLLVSLYESCLCRHQKDTNITSLEFLDTSFFFAFPEQVVIQHCALVPLFLPGRLKKRLAEGFSSLGSIYFWDMESRSKPPSESSFFKSCSKSRNWWSERNSIAMSPLPSVPSDFCG
jgi:hypothetical protein